MGTYDNFVQEGCYLPLSYICLLCPGSQGSSWSCEGCVVGKAGVCFELQNTLDVAAKKLHVCIAEQNISVFADCLYSKTRYVLAYCHIGRAPALGAGAVRISKHVRHMCTPVCWKMLARQWSICQRTYSCRAVCMPKGADI